MIPRVQDLEAGLVNRAEFARRQWFSAASVKTTANGVPMWYYHRPGRPVARCAGPEMYRKIDPNLRDLCLDLHRAGLGTLPSCEGHFHSREYFRAVWDELERHCDSIRTGGLPLVDSETDEQLLFANRDYELPWPSFSHFHEDLGTTQPGGYLGISLIRQDEHLAGEIERHPLDEARVHCCIQHPWPRSTIAAIYVDATCPEDGRRQWSGARRYIRGLLRKPRIATTVFPPLA